jgi:hypothetical protein
MGGKRVNRRRWIGRSVLTTLVLAGGVYAAEEATAPPPDIGSLITAQRIKQGELANQADDPEHQAQTLSPEQMLQLAGRYDTQMRAVVDHGETVRITAYRQRDIIRMTCVDDKLAQLREVIKVYEPRLQSLRQMQSEELVLRQHFLIVQQARKRVEELAAELEACMGEGLDAITAGRIRDQSRPSGTIHDPTRPPAPTHDVERPPEASPYR